MLATTAHCSLMFAAELRELTHTIERGEDVTHRIKVLREYAKTRGVIAKLYSHSGDGTDPFRYNPSFGSMHSV